jgi:hypothetical protein
MGYHISCRLCEKKTILEEKFNLHILEKSSINQTNSKTTEIDPMRFDFVVQNNCFSHLILNLQFEKNIFTHSLPTSFVKKNNYVVAIRISILAFQ